MSLKGLIDCKEEKDRESSVLSDSSSSAKRARLDYVATRPAALAARGGMGKTRPHKPANWLLGKTAPSGRGLLGVEPLLERTGNCARKPWLGKS